MNLIDKLIIRIKYGKGAIIGNMDNMNKPYTYTPSPDDIKLYNSLLKQKNFPMVTMVGRTIGLKESTIQTDILSHSK